MAVMQGIEMDIIQMIVKIRIITDDMVVKPVLPYFAAAKSLIVKFKRHISFKRMDNPVKPAVNGLNQQMPVIRHRHVCFHVKRVKRFDIFQCFQGR